MTQKKTQLQKKVEEMKADIPRIVVQNAALKHENEKLRIKFRHIEFLIHDIQEELKTL